jgi:hypothetical protein
MRLMGAVRSRIRRLGLARRTELAYVGWIKRFIVGAVEDIRAIWENARWRVF